MTPVRLNWSDHPPADCTGGAVTIGNFDGIHRGHRELIRTAKRQAQAVGGPCVVVTFDPPPVAILHPQSIKPPLSTVEERNRLALAAGADRVVTLAADAALVSLSPEAFFEDVVVRQFRAKALVEGSDFRFGRGRAGDVDFLKSCCRVAGLAFEIVPPVHLDNEPVSSSRVRTAIAAGQIATANRLLDRPYAIAGTVVAGAKRGRTIGIPTANLDRVPTLIPAVGVYACRASIDGRAWPAAANVGPNPTFGEDERKIEVHLIGFEGDLYGRELTVEFLEFLRPVRPFPNVNDLVAQLQADVARAAAVASERSS
jgi:riboflavin kinase/FMN adenylyltransferase